MFLWLYDIDPLPLRSAEKPIFTLKVIRQFLSLTIFLLFSAGVLCCSPQEFNVGRVFDIALVPSTDSAWNSWRAAIMFYVVLC